MKFGKLFWFIGVVLFTGSNLFAETVNIGFNYPATGPYATQGLAQKRAAELAVEEINASGGIMDKSIKLVVRDTQSKATLSTKNVIDLIDNHNVPMIFGGSSSSVAIAGGKAAKSKKKIYFGTTTYSNTTTGKEGHRYIFRECNTAWMGARVLAHYIRKQRLSKKRFFYITADYTWGHTTEESIRKFSNTSNKRRNKGVLTPFPGAAPSDFRTALEQVGKSKAKVLVLVLYGNDLTTALKLAGEMGIKQKMEAVLVPALDIDMAKKVGPAAMEGVVGAVSWCWKIPYTYNYTQGKEFVENFAQKYKTYPSSSAASAYTILYQYKDAVERAGTFDTKPVIMSLEGHSFKSLKDKQKWRKLDHQCLQTVYAVKCQKSEKVTKDKFKLDFFEVVNTMSANEAARGSYTWEQIRQRAGKPLKLEW